MKHLVENIKTIEHGFKHIIEAGNIILTDKTNDHFQIATIFLEDESYQVRMLSTYILGQLSPTNSDALKLLETKVAKDTNWRVQEMLAKAFDYYCETKGYEESLPIIRKWLACECINIRRAVVEGLRIWTSRPYFRKNPTIAIELISQNKADNSEYLRKSVGNALRDISKKHPNEVLEETATWDLTNPMIRFTHKLTKK